MSIDDSDREDQLAGAGKVNDFGRAELPRIPSVKPAGFRSQDTTAIKASTNTDPM
jgi:hypothetical protein